VHLATYAGGRLGIFNLRTGVAYAFHRIETSRSIVFPGFADPASASYDGSTGQVFGELGYGLSCGPVMLEPFAGLAFIHLHTDSLTEKGGAAALTGASNSENVGYSSLGLRAATALPLAKGMVLIPRASAAWQHAFGDVTPTAALAFSGGAPFTVAGVPIACDAAVVEAGADIALSRQAMIGVFYSGQVASRAQDHAVNVKLSWQF
jgi:outer membrane autotransporter protein